MIRRDPEPDVSAVLVSYNTAAMTGDCLTTLGRELAELPHEVIVVDNASADDTLERVAADHPSVHVIANPVNAGFGAANNLGMAVARGRLLLLINTDAFPEPGAIRRLVEHLDADPARGVTGPRLLNADRSAQPARFDFPTPARGWLENLGLSQLAERLGRRRPPGRDFASGACLLVRRAVFEKVGGFDEGFFMYSEETDWQRRIVDAGWTIGYEPESVVIHLGGGSQAAGRINPEFFRSVDLYQRKHHGRVGMGSMRLAMAVGAALRLGPRTLVATRSAHHAAKLRVHWYVLCRLASRVEPITRRQP